MAQSPAEGSAFVFQTMQGAVLDHLRHLILSRQLLPGERLVQGDLAERLGVSRTPIREALHRLAHEGLVTLSSYKGATVAQFSAADLEDVFAVRIALESYATSLAAQGITAEGLARLEGLLHDMAEAFHLQDPERLREAHHRFHAGIYAAANRPRLYALAVQYLDQANVYQRMALSLGRGARDPIAEHQDLLETLRRHDADAAGCLMRAHLEFTARELLELFDREAADA
jgi:DNA-binding GntR family transcriptional regulator